jgi:hypothetical protein
MSGEFDDETVKLIRLRRVTQQLQEKKGILQRVWANMQNFSQGLRNELDNNSGRRARSLSPIWRMPPSSTSTGSTTRSSSRSISSRRLSIHSGA